MIARDKLKECLECKHIIKCWKVDNQYKWQDPESVWIKLKSKLFLVKDMLTRKITMREFHAIYAAMYVQAALPNVPRETRIDIEQTLIMTTEAITNSTIDRWECPPYQKFEKNEETTT